MIKYIKDLIPKITWFKPNDLYLGKYGLEGNNKFYGFNIHIFLRYTNGLVYCNLEYVDMEDEYWKEYSLGFGNLFELIVVKYLNV